MSFKDIIKESFYNNFNGGLGLSMPNMVLILLFSCAAGMYIYMVYKKFSKPAFYSKDLNVTLAGMTVTVAAIMVAMQSNLLVSLGMVGALSIVRFRTAVKNPLDLLYLFWAISAGIICGVELYLLAVLLCLVMTLLIFILNKIRSNKTQSVLIIKTDDDMDLNGLEKIIKEHCRSYRSSSVSIKNGMKEIIYEVNSTNSQSLTDALNKIEGVRTVNYLEYSGELRN